MKHPLPDPRFDGDIYAVILISALCAALLDLLLHSIGELAFDAFWLVVASLLALGLVFIALFLLLWIPAGDLIRRFDMDQTSSSIAVACFLLFSFVLTSQAGLLKWPPSKSQLLRILIFLVVSALAGIGSYFLAGSIYRNDKWRSRILHLLFLLPSSLSLMLLIWFLRTSGRSPLSYAASLGGLILLIGLFLILNKFGRKKILLKLSLACLPIMFYFLPMYLILYQKSHPGNSAAVHGGHSIRHVFLITVDTLRADALSCYGNRGTMTPNIDRLTKDGVLFRRAVSPAPWTLASFTSIMTGLSPLIHMTTKLESRVPESLPTLSQQMKRAGYLTTAIVKNWNLTRGSFRGFDQTTVFPKRPIPTYGYVILRAMFPKIVNWDVSTQELTDVSSSWIKHHRNEDFFLWVHYLDPHLPYEPPPKYLPAKRPATRLGIACPRNMGIDIKSGMFVPTPIEKEWMKELYWAEVRYIDDSIGQLIALLKRMKLYDDSLIVFTSDHGEEFFEHDSFGHGQSVYNELLLVPLIIKLPNSARSGIIDAPVTTGGLMPTILDLCKLRYDPDSFSESSVLADPNSAGSSQSPVISTGILYYEDKISVVFENMKYIKNIADDREELYDLSVDPEERNSLVNVSRQKLLQGRSILTEKEKQVSRLRARYGLTKGIQNDLSDQEKEKLRALGYLQ